MKLIYATGNPAKLAFMRNRLCGLCEVEAPTTLKEVEENGSTPLENARLKAEAFARACSLPVLAADSGLYIDGLAADEQPGVHVRRVNGRRLDDDEMIAHYAAIAERFGGRVRAQYRNALYIALPGGGAAWTEEDDFHSEPFYIVSRPHASRRPGFPLDSLSVEIASGRYYDDLPDSGTHDMTKRQAYRRFVARALSIDYAE